MRVYQVFLLFLITVFVFDVTAVEGDGLSIREEAENAVHNE
jgi:hypothetical protein